MSASSRVRAWCRAVCGVRLMRRFDCIGRLWDAPRGRQQQCNHQVSRRLGQHAGRMADAHSVLGCCEMVNVIVPHRRARDVSQLRTGLDQLACARCGHHQHDGIDGLSLHILDRLRCRCRPEVQPIALSHPFALGNREVGLAASALRMELQRQTQRMDDEVLVEQLLYAVHHTGEAQQQVRLRARRSEAGHGLTPLFRLLIAHSLSDGSRHAVHVHKKEAYRIGLWWLGDAVTCTYAVVDTG